MNRLREDSQRDYSERDCAWTGASVMNGHPDSWLEGVRFSNVKLLFRPIRTLHMNTRRPL